MNCILERKRPTDMSIHPAANFYILVLVTLIINSCQNNSKNIDLDHYGEFENTPLNIDINGIKDSFQLNILNYQELFGVEETDTVLAVSNESVTFRTQITLERPSRVTVSIAGIMQEIFLIPDLRNDFEILKSSNTIEISFADPELEKINKYYRKKAKIGGDMLMRKVTTEILTQPSTVDIFRKTDSLELLLLENLKKMSNRLALPSWFRQYEKKQINYSSIATKTFASRVRRIIFDTKDSIDSRLHIKKREFDLCDTFALTTTRYLRLLPLFAHQNVDTFDIFDMDPVESLALRFQRSEFIPCIRIRDIYRSQLLFSAFRESIYFPDSLIQQIKKSISDEMQPYVQLIENKYNRFNGAPAPPLYLRDTTGNLLSLKDFRGNLVLLDFWFVGCRFCREELPYTKKLIEEFRNKNFKVLQICMKSELENWKKQKELFAGEPLYSNSGWDKKLTNDYQIQGYPRYVLIDEEGIILEGWCERPSDPGLKLRIEQYFAKN